MKKLIILFFPLFVFGQTESQNLKFNPKCKWYLGIEIGQNYIGSHEFTVPYNSFQGGVLVEYYCTKKFSLMGRIKYFETGVSYSNNSTSLNFGLFTGSVISVPIDAKWDIKMDGNLVFNLKTGLAYNYETKSEYYYGFNPDTEKSFVSFNAGFGFTYNVSNKMGVFIDLETFQFGGYKGNSGGLIFPKNYYTTNNLINLGIKYNFKIK